MVWKVFQKIVLYWYFIEDDRPVDLVCISLLVLGDVALMNLGMNEDDFTYLSTDIDFIIHSAAAVNLVYPYKVCTCNDYLLFYLLVFCLLVS